MAFSGSRREPAQHRRQTSEHLRAVPTRNRRADELGAAGSPPAAMGVEPLKFSRAQAIAGNKVTGPIERGAQDQNGNSCLRFRAYTDGLPRAAAARSSRLRQARGAVDLA